MEFADSYAAVAQKIRAALNAGDTEAAVRYAHTVKGVAGNFSAMALYEASQMLVTAFRRGRREDYKIVLRQFEQALNTVLAAAESFRVTLPQLTGTMINPEVEAMFRRLEILLQRNEFEAEECFESLKKHLVESIHQPELEVLSHHIRNLDFKNALTVLAELAQKRNIRMDGGANG